jgi:hypothetical protein
MKYLEAKAALHGVLDPHSQHSSDNRQPTPQLGTILAAHLPSFTFSH